MQKKQSVIDKILNTGVDDALPLIEKIRIQNVNRICIMAGSVALLLVPVVYDSIPAMTGILLYSLILYSVFFFHYWGKYSAFNLMIAIATGLLNLFFASFFDKRMGVEIFFIVTFVGTITHLENQKIRMFNALYTAICFIIALSMQYFDVSFFHAPRFSMYIFFVNLFTGFLFLTFSIISFRQKLTDSQNELMLKNKELEQNKQELAQTYIVKDKLFSIIGHDLRAPLNSISGILSLIEEGHLKEEDSKKYIRKLRTAIAGSNETIENIVFWYTQQKPGSQEMTSTVVLSELIDTVFNTLSLIAEQKKISISHDIAPDLKVIAETNFLSFLMRNLVSNAIKFTHEKGEVKISSLFIAPDKIRIMVKDNGVGIPPENIPLLFHQEDTFSTPGTNQEKGTGIGLPLSKAMADKNNIPLWVESEPGKGSTFYLELPVYSG
ncbi:MAG: HAMP domain-containing histidine kinase [Bacteroidia bacterium]|nr:HAMP domain-containing histidine kinase [Bacteroidia bacterium]